MHACFVLTFDNWFRYIRVDFRLRSVRPKYPVKLEGCFADLFVLKMGRRKGFRWKIKVPKTPTKKLTRSKQTVKVEALHERHI